MLLLLFLFPSFCKTDFAEDLAKITTRFSCDPSCTFNYSEITSETIQFFPKCSEICGILVINSNTKLSENELRDGFKTMQTLYGGLVIQDTQLTSLSFFNIDNIMEEFHFFCESYGFFIKNNSKLTDISILTQIYLWPDQDYNDCEFRIEDNPRLNIQQIFVDELSPNMQNIKAKGNLKDLECRIDEPSKNCTYLFGGLKINSDQKNLSFLADTKKIIGNIDIQNTDLTDLSFLKSVDWIQIKNIGLEEKVTINIQNNPKMTRLALPSLFEVNIVYSWPGNRLANLENLHPDFCLTIEEMEKFLGLHLKFKNLHAKFCKETGNLQGARLCRFDKLRNLLDNCDYILGDVKIESGDEEYVKKLEGVSTIFGSLIIKNTELKNLKFFSFLRSIGSLDDTQPVIQIVSNRNLEKAYLQMMEHIIKKGPLNILIENNHPNLFNSSNSHLLFPPPYTETIYTSIEYIHPPF